MDKIKYLLETVIIPIVLVRITAKITVGVQEKHEQNKKRESLKVGIFMIYKEIEEHLSAIEKSYVTGTAQEISEVGNFDYKSIITEVNTSYKEINLNVNEVLSVLDFQNEIKKTIKVDSNKKSIDLNITNNTYEQMDADGTLENLESFLKKVNGIFEDDNIPEIKVYKYDEIEDKKDKYRKERSREIEVEIKEIEANGIYLDEEHKRKIVDKYHEYEIRGEYEQTNGSEEYTRLVELYCEKFGADFDKILST